VNEFLIVLGAVLPVFTMAGAGFAMRKLCWLTEEADQSLLRVTVNLLVPCLIFHSILGNRAMERWDNVVLAPLVGFGILALGVGCGLLFRRVAGLGHGPRGQTFALSVGVFNYGYVPLPLAVLLFDQETVGVLLVHNVGVEIALWTIGLMLLSGATLRSGWKKIFNPPLFAIVVTLALNFAGGEAWVPVFIRQTTQLLGQCAIPLGLVLVGATIADQLPEFRAEKGWRVIAVSCLVRLGILPLLFLLLARYLPASIELKRVLVLQAAMPAAVFPILLAKHYGGDPATALRVVIGTSMLGFLTIPFWIRLGLAWIAP
jgi:malate permease and related proteins